MKRNQNVISFKDILLQHGFTQTITEPTRVTGSSSTLIDNIFIDYDIELQGEVVNTALSDHYGQTITLGLENAHVTACKKVCERVYSRCRLDEFEWEVSRLSWED